MNAFRDEGARRLRDASSPDNKKHGHHERPTGTVNFQGFVREFKP